MSQLPYSLLITDVTMQHKWQICLIGIIIWMQILYQPSPVLALSLSHNAQHSLPIVTTLAKQIISRFLPSSGSFQKFLECDSFIPESNSSFFLEIFFQFLQVLDSVKIWKQLEFDTSISCCKKLTGFPRLDFLQETGMNHKQFTAY